MHSTPTHHTHTGITAKELIITFGATGCMKHTVTVPAGTSCHKLDGGSDPWVVSDLRFIEDKRGIMYSDADIYGIRVPEAEITNIAEAARAYARPRG